MMNVYTTAETSVMFACVSNYTTCTALIAATNEFSLI